MKLWSVSSPRAPLAVINVEEAVTGLVIGPEAKCVITGDVGGHVSCWSFANPAQPLWRMAFESPIADLCFADKAAKPLLGVTLASETGNQFCALEAAAPDATANF